MTTGDPADQRPPADAAPDGDRSSRSPASPVGEIEGDAGADGRAGVRRGGPVWLILGVVAAALLVCCCSAVVGLLLSWAAGLFHTPPT